jgi:N-acetyl-anhydromuramyl-L-alanine amidase AmpD
VPDELAAWACGASQWQDVVGLNRHTLSLAFANRHDGVERLTAAQLERARALLAHWRGLYGIEDILSHAQISPGRKTDPERIPNFYLGAFG